MTLETDSEARKHAPVHTGFNQYFPDAIMEVAQLSFDSNEKHNPGEPLHWSRDKSDDHADCLTRHQLESGTIDYSDAKPHRHSTKVAWRAMAQLQIEIERDRDLVRDNPLFTIKNGKYAEVDSAAVRSTN